jgi:hypothetical protein
MSHRDLTPLPDNGGRYEPTPTLIIYTKTLAYYDGHSEESGTSLVKIIL